MPRPSHAFAPRPVAALMLLALAGCGGPDAARPAATPGPAQTAAVADQRLAEPPTPSRRVDVSDAVDIVRNEVRGGESEAGPTPMAYLFQVPDPKLVRDEPFLLSPPGSAPAPTIPAYNPMTKGRVELGKLLFFDPRVSKDGTVSCASCHDPAKGWTDHRPRSVGIGNIVGARNAPTILNAAFSRRMFADGRAESLEGQAQGPIQNKIEMGDQSYREIIERLRAIPGYRERFARVFGTDVTLDGLAKAVASFERTALSGDSAYDRYVNGAFGALADDQKRGMVLFGLPQLDDDPFRVEPALARKANCTKCHVGQNFTDDEFHNIGIGYDGATARYADLGRWAITPIGSKTDADRGAFKTPTIRDIARTGPYMHDGTEPTLEAVVEYYDRGGTPNPSLDPEIKPLHLTRGEKADLAAFLKALTSPAAVVALPGLPPGPDGRAVDPRDALNMGGSGAPKSTAASPTDPHAVVAARP